MTQPHKTLAETIKESLVGLYEDDGSFSKNIHQDSRVYVELTDETIDDITKQIVETAELYVSQCVKKDDLEAYWKHRCKLAENVIESKPKSYDDYLKFLAGAPIPETEIRDDKAAIKKDEVTYESVQSAWENFEPKGQVLKEDFCAIFELGLQSKHTCKFYVNADWTGYSRCECGKEHGAVSSDVEQAAKDYAKSCWIKGPSVESNFKAGAKWQSTQRPATVNWLGGIEIRAISLELSESLYVKGNYDFENGVRKGIEYVQSKLKERVNCVDPVDAQYLNMQYYMEYCQRNGYVTPHDWMAKHKHF